MTVALGRENGEYEAGQLLRAYWQIGQMTIDEVVGVEASVLWFTEGKGDEDLHIHHFVRWNDMQLQDLDLKSQHPIECVLPQSPITYMGTLLRIHWAVRVRLFRSVGRECVTQQPFYLVGALSHTESPAYL